MDKWLMILDWELDQQGPGQFLPPLLRQLGLTPIALVKYQQRRRR